MGSLGRTLAGRCCALAGLSLEGPLAGLGRAVALLGPLARDSGTLAGSACGCCRALLRTDGGVHAGRR